MVEDRNAERSRRTVLKAIGAAGATVALGGVAAGAENSRRGGDGDEDGDDGGDGSTGHCGSKTETTEHRDNITTGVGNEYSYYQMVEDPCSIEATLSSQSMGDVDLDLYATLDGREPTTDDFDLSSRGPGADQQITIDDVHAGMEIGLLVHSYHGTGDYVLTIDEHGKLGRPEAAFTIDPSPPVHGEEVVLDASEAFGRDAAIQSYEWRWESKWNFLPGSEVETATGEQATVTFHHRRPYEVRLMVTDTEGRTHFVTKEVMVRPDWDDWF